MDHQGIRKRESSSCKCSACAWELTPISFGLPENPVDSYPHTTSHYVFELCPYNNHARPRRCEQVSCQNAIFQLVQACAIPIKPHSCGLSCLQTKTAVKNDHGVSCQTALSWPSRRAGTTRLDHWRPFLHIPSDTSDFKKLSCTRF